MLSFSTLYHGGEEHQKHKKHRKEFYLVPFVLLVVPSPRDFHMRNAVILIGVAAVFAAANLAGQQPQKQPYDQLMKDVAAAYASVKKNLDAGAGPAAAADAAKLEGLFKETEAFWTQFKTKDALDAAKGAQQGAAAIAAAARANNIQKAQASYAGVGKFCAACHTSHREQMPDKSFRIKP
jgi:cytochrome c556